MRNDFELFSAIDKLLGAPDRAEIIKNSHQPTNILFFILFVLFNILTIYVCYWIIRRVLLTIIPQRNA